MGSHERPEVLKRRGVLGSIPHVHKHALAVFLEKASIFRVGCRDLQYFNLSCSALSNPSMDQEAMKNRYKNPFANQNCTVGDQVWKHADGKR